jgi:hypothetical protein
VSVKPNLFIVGAPKCGTTAWVEYLGSHPEIFFPERKEPSFFCPDLLPEQRVQSLEDYLALFADAGAASVVGEASPTYLRSEEAPRRIAQFDPKAKILIFLREQEDFLPSLHNQLVYNGEEPIEDFETAWRRSGKRRRDEVPASCNDLRLLDYKAAGRFREQVERYFAYFPPEQILVFQFRDWVAHPRDAYLAIFEFLGLQDDGLTDFPPVNEARSRRTQLFVKLVNAPPPGALRLAAMLKRLTRKSSLGVARKLREIGSRPGYSSGISPQLRDEIRGMYADDNRRLEHRLWWAPAPSDLQDA